MLIYITQGIVLGLYAAVIPGPFQAFLLSETLRSGWKRTLPAALAPLISDGPVLLAFLLVLSRLPEVFLNLLRFGGGLFLLFLAWGTCQASRAELNLTGEPQPGAPRSLLKAALMNLLNPNVYIFWGTIGAPLALEGMAVTFWHGMSFILTFYGVMIPAIGGMIYLFGTLGRLGARAQRVILQALAVLLLGMGLYQIWQGVLGFVG